MKENSGERKRSSAHDASDGATLKGPFAAVYTRVYNRLLIRHNVTKRIRQFFTTLCPRRVMNTHLGGRRALELDLHRRLLREADPHALGRRHRGREVAQRDAEAPADAHPPGLHGDRAELHHDLDVVAGEREVQRNVDRASETTGSSPTGAPQLLDRAPELQDQNPKLRNRAQKLLDRTRKLSLARHEKAANRT